MVVIGIIVVLAAPAGGQNGPRLGRRRFRVVRHSVAEKLLFGGAPIPPLIGGVRQQPSGFNM